MIGGPYGDGDVDPVRVAFVCVQNAGRSQMARAFAERERERRGVADRIRVTTGGTDPADRIHEEVVDAMREVGVDLADRTPRAVTPDEMAEMDVVVTMGCSAEGVCPATWRGDARDWALSDPDGRDPDEVRAIRDEVERRVRDLFDELVGEGGAGDGRAAVEARDELDDHVAVDDTADDHAAVDDTADDPPSDGRGAE